MRTVRDADGKLTGFTITKEDKAILQKCIEIYQGLIPYCPPGVLAGGDDFVGSMMASGYVAVAPFYWGLFWEWGYAVEKEVPGAKLGYAPVVGGRPYYGCFPAAVSYETKNPEAAYWLARYLGCRELQQEAAEIGWDSCRIDVLMDPKYEDPKWVPTILNREPITVMVESLDRQFPYCAEIMNTNSSAAGKIYEQQIIILSDAAGGRYTAQQAVDQLVSVTIDLQTRFGTMPITEEK